MVRHVTTRLTADWKAILAVTIVLGGLLWHLLACTESPMAFSPNGKDLAFVTMEPYRHEENLAPGVQAFRLMVLTEGSRLRVIEQTTSEVLSAPAYNPDGTRLCYLRISLFIKKDWDRLKHRKENAMESSPAKRPATEPENAGGQSSPSSATQPAPSLAIDDWTLPSAEQAVNINREIESRPEVPVTLVVRDAQTDAIVSATRMGLPIISSDEDWTLAYLTVRPQYGSDGQWIYLTAGNVAFAVNPVQGRQRILAAPVATGALSPDGQVLAVSNDKPGMLGFVQTDGQSTLYKRWEKNGSLSGMTWADRHTLAWFEPKEKGMDSWLHLVRPDGTIRKSIAIHLPNDINFNESKNTGELAMAPNGRYVVLAFGQDVLFMRSDGKIRKRWHGEGELMAQPTFSPDSKRVAFKSMKTDEAGYLRATAIVFCSPDGKELARSPIPPIAPGTTRASP